MEFFNILNMILILSFYQFYMQFDHCETYVTYHIDITSKGNSRAAPYLTD